MSSSMDTATQPSRSATTLIFIRHGETQGNVEQVWHGEMDAPLTDRGKLQVDSVAKGMVALMDEYPVDAFYVSPLPRARATASAIAESIDVQPIIDNGLREFSLGQWEGRTFRDLHETENLWGQWAKDRTYAPPGGESPASFHQRALDTMEEIVNRHRGQTILVVTHGALISNVLATWLGNGPQDWQRFDPHNCAIAIIQLPPSRDGNGSQWTAIRVNDVSHLPPEAITEKPAYWAGSSTI